MRDIKLWLDAGALLLIFWLIWVFIAPQAQAADLLIGQRTYHFVPNSNWDECKGGDYECSKPFNNSQELIGIANNKWAVLYMHQNSVREKSVVIVRTYKTNWGKYVRPFAAVGAATGYKEFYPKQSVGDVTPTAYFGADIHPANDKVGLVITWQPKGFVGAGLRFKL